MDDKLFHIIYLSTAVKLFTQQDLDELLMVSRKNNKKVGITGMLLYHEGVFFQVLEGQEDRVKSLYDFIKLDKRHHSARVIRKGSLSCRLFPDWSMAYHTLEAPGLKEGL